MLALLTTSLGVKLLRRFDASSFGASWPYSELDLARMDPSPDIQFYETPRFVTHIDDGAIRALTDFYRQELTSGADVLDLTLDIARIGLAAEMLGSLQECFERTVAYLKEREQFGVPIGSFQALKHRAADMFCEVELSKSCVLEALSALDEGRDATQVASLASLTKTKVGETFHQVSREGIQMHGGIGMTDEFDIGFFIKRAAVAEQTLGDSSFHRNRYGELEGY